MTDYSADVLVIGSGIAGLAAALEIARNHSVIVATSVRLMNQILSMLRAA